jgi:ubiquinone/menaquinone biosynthesis C-methylase UbiE
MKWFQLSVRKLIGMSADKSENKKLEDALDFKYGNYDYNDDARSVDEVGFEKAFRKILSENIGLPNDNKSILLTGSNDGYELKYLNGFKVTALDLSGKALNKLMDKFPKIEAIQANIESLPFADQTFDVYISLRAIHSSNVNLQEALKESLRVTKENGVLIYSVSNAYRENGNLVKGMYIPTTQKLDEKKPYTISNEIKSFLDKKGLRSETIEISSEIFIIAKK